MTEAVEKIKLLRSSPDLSAATYQIHDESHTIGNSLRWMLMKNPKVEFCGYSAPVGTAFGHIREHVYQRPYASLMLSRFISLHPTSSAPPANTVPHPSENVINVRIQMYDNLSSLDALITALSDLDKLCETVEDAYIKDLRENKYEKWEERR
ncbi:hypothetical protein NLJ89_g7275 [Agrocybe chaxingu]|uniref:DNA-directed RNA polymerase RBP11-like dimerisation domain-containing protein n=1 Tax=Agrocybe chaxingu TaxID=84603 RepID=A0A9W8JXN6_9AGAR|nr:hypothetical protein NLJ89_g7275 [Agrocybe chaxingu]